MDDKRNHRIYCRLTSAEYGRFKTEVRKTYLSDSEYIRRKLLHPQMRIRSREETDLLNFVIGSLSQVNNNINQIARVMNALKGSGAVVLGSVAQRQLNQVEAILKEWNTFEGRLRQCLKSI